MKTHVILLVSSDPEVTCLVEDEVLSERHGFRHIADREIALRTLSEDNEDIDLAILDLDPGIGGLNLLNVAHDRLPVLLLTSTNAADVARIVRHHGACGCLTKPCTKAQLHNAIHTLLSPKVAVA